MPNELELENQTPEEVSEENNPTLYKRIKNWNPNVALGLKISGGIGAGTVGFIAGAGVGLVTSPGAGVMTGIKVFRSIWKPHNNDRKPALIICPPLYGVIATIANPFIDAIAGSALCATHVFNKDFRKRNIKMKDMKDIKDILKLTTNPMSLLDFKDKINAMEPQPSTSGVKQKSSTLQ